MLADGLWTVGAGGAGRDEIGFPCAGRSFRNVILRAAEESRRLRAPLEAFFFWLWVFPVSGVQVNP